ncbi:MAG: DUF4139 domain-containing protein [Candidatus Hydrogenedentes bacterium]|nr:DUF4139 domain-containing protein [Candidatus Hydrogenedentota bacterium]
MRISIATGLALAALSLPPSAQLTSQDIEKAVRDTAPQYALSDPLAAKEASQESTLEDQTDLAITVYNASRALVRDRRAVKLQAGEHALRFMDVAESILPETVSLQSLSAPGKLHILEQNYEFDLMSPEKLMEKYVGKKVKLINQNKDLDFVEKEATLLSVNNGPVYEVDGAIYLGHPGNVVLPSIPEELIAKPTLIWLLNNEVTDHEVEATYITGGIDWKADYVVTLNREETALNLEGWVTLNNQSGATYRNAELKLVAGEVNVVQDRMDMPRMAKAAMMEMAAGAPAMVEEAFGEYHLYTLPRRTTIKQNQSKQVSLLTGTDIKANKIYEYRGNVSYYAQRIPQVQDKIDVFLKFQNEEANQLGVPLPAGIMRVYQPDSSGALQFSGEDRLNHTPKDEEVRLRLGQAFDVTGERVQTNYNRLSDNVHDASFEITLKNHKETDITVDVVEPMPGDWEMRDNNLEYEKKDAFTAIFHVPVKADGEAVVKYTVRVTF